MNTWNRILGAMALCLAIACLGCGDDGVTNPDRSTITITTVPSGLEVILDDTPTGMTTPATFTDLEPKEHTVRILLEGHFPAESTFTVANIPSREVSLRLDPAPNFHIAYTDQDTIFVVGLDGMHPAILATDCYRSSDNKSLKWSPNGKCLVYMHRDGFGLIETGQSQTYYIAAYHMTQRADYAWSHTGNELAIHEWWKGLSLFTVDDKIKELVVRTTYANSPAFSPNDSIIFYIEHSYGTRAWGYLRNIRSEQHISMTNRFRTAWDEQLNPAWISHSEILFKSSGNDSAGIYYLNVADTFGVGPISPERIISVNGKIQDFSISPNGRYYAFSTWEEYQPSELYYGLVGDWSPTLLLKIDEFQSLHFSWSPASDAIAVRYPWAPTRSNIITWITLGGNTYRIVPSSNYLGHGDLTVGP
ncbi:PEGA domain-containing protein [Patescibacteria group bacterium]